MRAPRRTSLTSADRQYKTPIKDANDLASKAGSQSRRNSSSATGTTSQPFRRPSVSSWVFNQDYWRGPADSNKATVIGKKGPIVIIIRHAQALHNVKQPTRELQQKLYQIRDTPLTPEGIQQAASIQTRYPGLAKIVNNGGQRVKVFSSPLSRALQTTYTAFPCLKAGQAILAPDLQEVTAQPFDIGSVPDDLLKRMNAFNQDRRLVFIPGHFAALGPEWHKKEGPYAFENEAILKRARRFRRYIKSLDLDYVVLVTHGGFIPSLCEDRNWERSDNDTWNNAEARIFRFDPADASGHAGLVRLPGRESLAFLQGRAISGRA